MQWLALACEELRVFGAFEVSVYVRIWACVCMWVGGRVRVRV